MKSETRINNREAVGWYDHDAVYLPTNRASEAAGGVLKEQRIAAVLDREGTCLAAAVRPGSRSDGCPGSAVLIAMRCGVASLVDPTGKPTPTSYTR